MVQRPIICGWEILKINLACLLSRSPNPNQRIGGAYLGNLLRREPLYVFAKRLLQRDAVIIDFEALFSLSNDWQTLYEKVEKQSGIKGFASVRQELGNDRPVQEIYSEIRRRLGTAPPFALEVAIWQDMCLVNPYIERAAEIGVINGRPVRILGILPYPREAVMKLIGQTKARKAELKLERKFSPNQLRECFDGREPRDTAVVSSVYSRIKAAEKNGQKGLYYESPRGFMRKIHHPALSRRFQLLYDGLCGVGLFSGECLRTQAYELAFLCLAPAVFGFMQEIARRADSAGRVLCLTEKEHPFYRLYTDLMGNMEAVSWYVPEALMRGEGAAQGQRDAMEDQRLLVVDPVPGSRRVEAYCQAQEERAVPIEQITMSGYLNRDQSEALAHIMTERTLMKGLGQKDMVYHATMREQTFFDIWDAVEDFSRLFHEKGVAPIEGEDAAHLLEAAEQRAPIVWFGREGTG